MSKRFKQVNIQQFAILVQEVDISKYSQEEYVDIIEEIYNWELLNSDKDLSKSEKLIDDSIKVFDSLIFKINSVNKEDSKKEFKSINDEKVKLLEELNKKFSKL